MIPLVQARARVRDLLHDASKGADPAAEKQAGRKAEMIGDLAALHIEKWAKLVGPEAASDPRPQGQRERVAVRPMSSSRNFALAKGPC